MNEAYDQAVQFMHDVSRWALIVQKYRETKRQRRERWWIDYGLKRGRYHPVFTDIDTYLRRRG
jgi:hypothetical protein